MTQPKFDSDLYEQVMQLLIKEGSEGAALDAANGIHDCVDNEVGGRTSLIDTDFDGYVLPVASEVPYQEYEARICQRFLEFFPRHLHSHCSFCRTVLMWFLITTYNQRNRGNSLHRLSSPDACCQTMSGSLEQ